MYHQENVITVWNVKLCFRRKILSWILIFELSFILVLFKYRKRMRVSNIEGEWLQFHKRFSKICVNLVDFPHSKDTSLVSQRNVQHQAKEHKYLEHKYLDIPNISDVKLQMSCLGKHVIRIWKTPLIAIPACSRSA